MNRVVITGMGAISPFGMGVKTLCSSIWQGKNAVKFMSDWQYIKGLNSFLAAPVPYIDVKKLIKRNLRRTMGPMAIWSVLAAREAIKDAKLTQDELSSNYTGVIIGSTTGSPSIYEEFYREFLPNETIEGIKSGVFFKIMGHSCAANVCLDLKIKGHQWATTSACTSSSQAIGLGFILLKMGVQNIIICGGADEVHPTVTMVFDILKAASRKNETPQNTPRPFDKNRDGVVCGGGAGILILETLESARNRNAKIYAELLGFSLNCDSQHIANPDTNQMANVMLDAIKEADINTKEVDYISAHATGTSKGDIAEAQAIKKVFGKNTPTSSIKGHIGHSLGAAGVLESIVAIECLKKQQLVPTLNLEDPDPECDIELIQHKIVPHKIDIIVKNNFALGGVNTSLVLRRWNSNDG